MSRDIIELSKGGKVYMVIRDKYKRRGFLVLQDGKPQYFIFEGDNGEPLSEGDKHHVERLRSEGYFRGKKYSVHRNLDLPFCICIKDYSGENVQLDCRTYNGVGHWLQSIASN